MVRAAQFARHGPCLCVKTTPRSRGPPRPHTVRGSGDARGRLVPGHRVGLRRADPAQRTGPRLNVKGGAARSACQRNGNAPTKNGQPGESWHQAFSLFGKRPTSRPRYPHATQSDALDNDTSTMTTCRTKNFPLPRSVTFFSLWGQ
jgi:hypothetical protein